MQYYSLQQCTLLSPDTSKTEHHISFGPASSFWSHFFALSIIMYAYQLGGSSSDVISLCPLILLFGILRQKYWSGLPFPSPGDLPNPGIEPRSPTLQADALTSEPPGKQRQKIVTRGGKNTQKNFPKKDLHDPG